MGAAAGRAISAELEHLSAEQESLSREIADSIQPTGLPAGLELLDDVESLSFDDKRTVARILIDWRYNSSDLEELKHLFLFGMLIHTKQK